MSVSGPASPCVRLCNYNPFLGVCEGCFRNLEEIGGWSGYTPGQKAEVLAGLEERRKAAEERARGAVTRSGNSGDSSAASSGA